MNVFKIFCFTLHAICYTRIYTHTYEVNSIICPLIRWKQVEAILCFPRKINVHSQISTPLREILIKEFPLRALTALSSINNKRESYATSKSNFRVPPRTMINDFGRWYWWTAVRELCIIASAIGSCFQPPRIINLVVSDCAYFL